MAAKSNSTAPNSERQNLVPKSQTKRPRKWQKIAIPYTLADAPLTIRPRRPQGYIQTSTKPNPHIQNIAQRMAARPYMATTSVKKAGNATTWDDLCADVKLLIYNFACQDTRVLELQWDDSNGVVGKESHYRYRPTAAARRPPTILGLSHDARTYALGKHYRLVNFTSSNCNISAGIKDISETYPMYYNPEADITYFGTNSCMRTIVQWIYDMHLKDIPVKRVALLCSGSISKICHQLSSRVKDTWMHQLPPYFTSALDFNAQPMDLLHGLDESCSNSPITVGLPLLKDVFWIVPTRLIDNEAGNITPTMGMRPPICEGLTDGQVLYKEAIKQSISMVESGEGLHFCQWQVEGTKNRWVDDKMPTFQFMSFCPIIPYGALAGAIHDGMTIPETLRWKVTWESGYLAGLERTYGVMITMPTKDFPGAKIREIGLFGHKDDIELVKKVIRDRITNWVPPNQEYQGPNSQRGRGGRGSRGGQGGGRGGSYRAPPSSTPSGGRGRSY